jgi:MFS family permease
VRKLFAEPGFSRLFAGLSTSMLGDSVMLLVLSMWVKTLTDSNALAGFTFFFMVLPALGAPLLGVWVDRLPRKPILVWGNLASAAAVLPLVLVRDEGDVWLIWAVAFLYGVSFTVLPAAVNGLLKELLPEDLLVGANSSLATIKEGFRLFGPLLGAALFATTGGWLVAVVDAASFVVAAGVIASIRVTETAPPPRTGFRAEVVAGLHFIAGDRVLRNVLTGLGASILVIGFFESSIYALLDAFDRAPTFAGIVVTVQGVGAVAGGLTSSVLVRRLGEVAGTVVGLATMALGTAVAAAAPNMAVVLVGVVGLGIALPWTFVAFTTLMQRRSPHHLIGRVSATADVLLSAPQTLSLAAGALLVSVLDYRAIFWIIAAVMLASAVQIAVVLHDQIRSDVGAGGIPVDPVPAPQSDLTPGADLL